MALPTAPSRPDEGVIAGYASVFHARDLAGDTVLPGAFAATLRRRGPGGIRMLYQHDPGQPIGAWTRVVEDRRGLWAEGRLTLEVERAREVADLIRAGALDGLSIGFRARAADTRHRAGARRLAAIDLWEISIVTFPLLDGARVTAIDAMPLQPPVAGAIRRAARTVHP